MHSVAAAALLKVPEGQGRQSELPARTRGTARRGDHDEWKWPRNAAAAAAAAAAAGGSSSSSSRRQRQQQQAAAAGRRQTRSECPLTALCVGAGNAVGAAGGANSGGSAGIARSAAVPIARGARGTQRADLEIAHHDAVAAGVAGGGHVVDLLLGIGQAAGNHCHSKGIHVGGDDGGLQQEGGAQRRRRWVGAGAAGAGGGSGGSSRISNSWRAAPTLVMA